MSSETPMGMCEFELCGPALDCRAWPRVVFCLTKHLHTISFLVFYPRPHETIPSRTRECNPRTRSHRQVAHTECSACMSRVCCSVPLTTLLWSEYRDCRPVLRGIQHTLELIISATLFWSEYRDCRPVLRGIQHTLELIISATLLLDTFKNQH